MSLLSVLMFSHLFSEFLKHMDGDGLKTEQLSLIELLKTFKKKISLKKYGPKVCVQFVKCLNEFAKVSLRGAQCFIWMFLRKMFQF